MRSSKLAVIISSTLLAAVASAEPAQDQQTKQETGVTSTWSTVRADMASRITGFWTACRSACLISPASGG